MLSVVVPTYNEAGNVRNLACQIDNALKDIDYELIFVDDSTDDTPERIKELEKKYKGVRLIHRTRQKGLATAVLRGFSEAKGEYLACIDADLQHPPITLKYMYYAMEAGADVCLPSRFLPGGADGGLNFYRKFVSWSARKIGQVMLPALRRLSDPTSGLFMIKRSVIEGVKLNPVGWKIMIEVIAMGNYKKVIEIPYRFASRHSGASKLSQTATKQYIQQLRDLSTRYNKKNKFKLIRWSYAKMMHEAKEPARPLR